MDKEMIRERIQMKYFVFEAGVIALFATSAAIDLLQIFHGVRLTLENCHWYLQVTLLGVLIFLRYLAQREQGVAEQKSASRKNRRI
jgi:hypothetical protein